MSFSMLSYPICLYFHLIFTLAMQHMFGICILGQLPPNPPTLPPRKKPPKSPEIS
jgi:hypothetical protein